MNGALAEAQPELTQAQFMLPDELWSRIFEDEEAAAACLEINHAMHALARDAIVAARPPEIAALLKADTCIQSDLVSTLLLSPDAVRSHPHDLHARFGGGTVHVFNPTLAIPELMRAHDGIKGFFMRRNLKRDRECAKRKRDDEILEMSKARKRKLETGLGVLGIPRRSDSTLSNQYIEGNKNAQPLNRVLETMAHMHYLHSHTDGAYDRAVQTEVENIADDEGFFYEGIYQVAVRQVQSYAQFKLPEVLPWLSEFQSTREALDAAFRSADPSEFALFQKRSDLQARRDAALASRIATLDAALAERQWCFITSSQELRKQLEKLPQAAIICTGDFFSSKTLTCKTKLDTLLKSADCAEKICTRLEWIASEAKRLVSTHNSRTVNSALVNNAANVWRWWESHSASGLNNKSAEDAVLVLETYASQLQARSVEIAATVAEEALARTRRKEAAILAFQKCTMRECTNKHALRNPPLGPHGPVCRRCAKL